VVGTAVQVGFHYYLWRRLVRDGGWPARPTAPRRSAMVVLGLSTPATIWLNRADVRWIGPTLGWVSFPWMALVAITTSVAGRARSRAAGCGAGRGDRRRGAADVDLARRRALARMTGGAAVVAGAATVGGRHAQRAGGPEVVTVEIGCWAWAPRSTASRSRRSPICTSA
jgi:hypothetical protein